MSQSEAEFLQQWETFGFIVTGSMYGGILLGTILWAFQFFMVVYGLSVFFGLSKDQRKGRIVFIIFSLVILVFSSIDMAIDMWKVFRILYSGQPSGSSYYEAVQEDFVAYGASSVAGDAMFAVVVLAGDALMIWRTLVLWSHRKWVIILPSVTCMGSIICHIIYLVPSRSIGTIETYAVRAGIAANSLSVAVNIMVTFLILFRLTKTQLLTSKAFGPNRKPSKMYSDVAAIIIESAAPLAFFGIGSIVCLGLQHWEQTSIIHYAKLTIASDVFGWFYASFCALSPQMIIFRVTLSKSWKNAEESKNATAALSQPIQFARTVPEASSQSSSSV